MSGTIEEFVDQITRERDSFAYFGDLDPQHWGYCFGQSRDSEVRERANWEAIKEEMSAFPEDWRVEGSSHWAVGWVDEGRVRIYLNDVPSLGYTDALRKAYEIACDLADYPVLDEARLSDMEYEEFHEQMDSEIPREYNRMGDELPGFVDTDEWDATWGEDPERLPAFVAEVVEVLTQDNGYSLDFMYSELQIALREAHARMWDKWVEQTYGPHPNQIKLEV